jgi:hypothetical protein
MRAFVEIIHATGAQRGGSTLVHRVAPRIVNERPSADAIVAIFITVQKSHVPTR